MTRKEEVLDRLRLANGAWVDGSELATEQVGGSEGLKRLREARAEGHPIEERHHPDPRRSIWQYRLVPNAAMNEPDTSMPVRRTPSDAERIAAAVLALSRGPNERVRLAAAVNAPGLYRCAVCHASVDVQPSVLDPSFLSGLCRMTRKCPKAPQTFRAK